MDLAEHPEQLGVVQREVGRLEQRYRLVPLLNTGQLARPVDLAERLVARPPRGGLGLRRALLALRARIDGIDDPIDLARRGIAALPGGLGGVVDRIGLGAAG